MTKISKEELSKIKYINLKNKTSYSVMTAIGLVKDHLKTCKEKGHAGLCITDTSVMMASLDQYNVCKNEGFPSVLGTSMSAVANTDLKHALIKPNTIGIYVKNIEGYRNAAYISSLATIDDKFYKTPRIDYFDIFSNKNGIMVSCGGFTGAISQAIIHNRGFAKKYILNNIKNEELISKIDSIEELQAEQITELVDLSLKEESETQKIRNLFNEKYFFESIKYLLNNSQAHFLLNEKFPISKEKIKIINSEDFKEDGNYFYLLNLILEFNEEELIQVFKSELKEDFYLELSFIPKNRIWDKEEKTHIDLDNDPNKVVIERYIELSKKFNVKIIAVQDSYMKNEEDHILQSIMLWNRPGSKDGFYFPEAQYIMTLEEMYSLMNNNYPFVTNEQFIEWTSNSYDFIEKSKDLVLKFKPSLPRLSYEEHYVNKVPVVIKRELMNELQDAELWNEEIKARIRKNQSIQDEELIPKNIKEKFKNKEEVIDFDEMKSREEENIFLEKCLNDMEVFYKEKDKKFVKLLKKSKKDLSLRTSLKVMMRNKKLVPKNIDKEKIQAIIDKNEKTKGKKISDFPPELIERLAEKNNFFVEDIDPMLLLGNDVVRDRLTYELNTIQYNGILRLITYFMLLEDISNFINENGYLRGLGRGSGAGSIVAYGLDITDCDPLRYDLLFERFLTKERIGEVFTNIEGFDQESFFQSINFEELDDESLVKELTSLIDKSRDTENLKLWKDDELFFMECNPEIIAYYLDCYKKLSGKKVKNINNSTVAYLIGLSDEIPTDTINATPTTLPDIDYDTNARDQVKEYLVYKFGMEYVTLMGTFGTLKTKGAIKDVLRQLRPDMNFKDVNLLTKHFENIKETDYKSDLDYFNAGLSEIKELRDFFEENIDVKENVVNILGNIKSTGVHAGGIVVAGDDVTRVVPCLFERKKEKMWVTQPDMKYVEWAGLIKYDFLGLNTLNDINRCFRLIERRYGKILSYPKIPLNDPVVMRKFRQGDVMSIFQFGTFLAHSILVQLKEVNNINDLAIITSIARPGPLDMGMDKTFIKRVNKEEPITYFHESLALILKDTYGIVCYQESVMAIVRELGDLTGNESVVVLKAMGKKQLDKLNKFKKKFIENATKKYPEMGELVDFEDPESKEMKKVSLGEKIWLYLEAFAKYGFNKSHAIAYSTISYFCMWLKHYYEIEWITSVLSGSSKDDFKEFYAQWHSKILKPDINKSKKDYIIEEVEGENKCIMPFSFINGVGDKAVESIVNAQPFYSFEDFFNRVDKRRVNKTSIINLIMSGSFDSLKESIINQKKELEGVTEEEIVTLDSLSIAGFRKMIIKDFFELKRKQKKPSKKEQLEIDEFMDELNGMNRGNFLMKEVSLLNLTAFNYYEFYKDHMTRGAMNKFGQEAITPKEALKAKDKSQVVIGGAIESIRFFPIKNGKSRGKDMARLVLINEDSKINVTVFAGNLETDSSGRNIIRDLEEFTPVILKGTIQKDPKYGTSLIFNKGWDLSK